jgi:hypothetical protein
MASIKNQCAVCPKPGKLCASCENIHYCSPECQKTDWKVHKLLCRTFKDFRNPPGPMWMRVIAFPVNSTKPEFRWMPIKQGTIQRPMVDKYFGYDNPLTGFISFPQDPKSGKQLPLRITIQSRDSFLTDGSLPNRALIQLTEGELRQKFAGPVLVYGNALTSHDGIIGFVNLDTTHLNTIKDWFIHGFYVCPNETIYRQRFEQDTEVFEFGITKEVAEDMEKDLLAKGETSPNFRPEDFGTPEFCLWHDKVGRYKQEWAKRKQDEEIASGKKAAGGFTRLMSEEEEASRSEMRVSGRVVGLDVVLP